MFRRVFIPVSISTKIKNPPRVTGVGVKNIVSRFYRPRMYNIGYIVKYLFI